MTLHIILIHNICRAAVVYFIKDSGTTKLSFIQEESLDYVRDNLVSVCVYMEYVS